MTVCMECRICGKINEYKVDYNGRDGMEYGYYNNGCVECRMDKFIKELLEDSEGD